jgi:hypothetical protein
LFLFVFIFCFDQWIILRSLWGGSVINLGTQKHKDKYYDGIDNLDFPGCFAMTELHHGNFLSAYFLSPIDLFEFIY